MSRKGLSIAKRERELRRKQRREDKQLKKEEQREAEKRILVPSASRDVIAC